jgi:hypothetical protein
MSHRAGFILLAPIAVDPLAVLAFLPHQHA